jgi:2-C-methyl-D-erythritol 4-phosphate cytidylyltransferase
VPDGALEVWCVVVAAGSGERLGADRPKAFVRLGNRTLVAASLEAFEEHPGIDGVVCVVPEGWEERLSGVVDDLAAGKVAAAVAGGASRADSVRRGLELVPEGATFVLVHDAARPLLTTAVIDAVLIGLADGADGVVPALLVTDTVKRVGADGTVVETLRRGDLRAVQTPQGFRADVLRRAIAAAGPALADATDCASLVERAGGRVVCVDGDAENLKVTSRADLRRAADLLEARRG